MLRRRPCLSNAADEDWRFEVLAAHPTIEDALYEASFWFGRGEITSEQYDVMVALVGMRKRKVAR